jgi:2-keto-4-pentenoate hydratase
LLALQKLPYYHTSIKVEIAMNESNTRFGLESVEIARRFVSARMVGLPLAAYPGAFPRSREEAYVIQDEALRLWPEQPTGWKVALAAPAFRESFGEDRLSGPVFPKATLRSHSDKPVEFPIFDKGFAAVEAEFIAIMKSDAPFFNEIPTAEQASALVGAMHIGIETAGSQLPQINDLGPLAVVSDFGNNAGVIIGPEIGNWCDRSLESLKARMYVDDQEVGVGHAGKIPGGPMAAVAFLLFHLQQRGMPLMKGQFISTGATTGIHPVKVGSRVRADFGIDGSIEALAL